MPKLQLYLSSPLFIFHMDVSTSSASPFIALCNDITQVPLGHLLSELWGGSTFHFSILRLEKTASSFFPCTFEVAQLTIPWSKIREKWSIWCSTSLLPFSNKSFSIFWKLYFPQHFCYYDPSRTFFTPWLPRKSGGFRGSHIWLPRKPYGLRGSPLASLWKVKGPYMVPSPNS